MKEVQPQQPENRQGAPLTPTEKVMFNYYLTTARIAEGVGLTFSAVNLVLGILNLKAGNNEEAAFNFGAAAGGPIGVGMVEFGVTRPLLQKRREMRAREQQVPAPGVASQRPPTRR